MKVLLEKGCWLADWSGDPGRTILEENAKEFKTRRSANMAIKRARRYRPFEAAEIIN